MAFSEWNKTFPEQMLTQIYVTIMPHDAAMSQLKVSVFGWPLCDMIGINIKKLINKQCSQKQMIVCSRAVVLWKDKLSRFEIAKANIPVSIS